MHLICVALPPSIVQVRVTRGYLVAHRHSFATPHFSISLQYPLIVYLTQYLMEPSIVVTACSMVWD